MLVVMLWEAKLHQTDHEIELDSTQGNAQPETSARHFSGPVGSHPPNLFPDVFNWLSLAVNRDLVAWVT